MDRAACLLTPSAATAVLDAARSTGFGAAVAQALAAVDRERTAGAAGEAGADRWVWLLHDDCAPAADALERLVAFGAADSAIGVAGCRVRAWPRGRRLLEVGATITGTGHRETGVEPGEYDQGQFELRRDVLAVSSAAMLVRRSWWDRLGGFDPELPMFGDDLDFGWRAAKLGCQVAIAPGAVVFHAEAAARGVRAITCTTPHPQRAARRAALFTLLANCRRSSLPWQYLRLVFGSMLRAAGFLLAKLPSAAWNEAAAAVGVLGRPDRIFAWRSRRRTDRGGDPARVRALLPAWWTPYANAVDVVSSQFVGRSGAADSAFSASWLLRGGRRDATSHPLLALLAALAVAGLVASRGLWGDGFLQGGGLLPAPDSAANWWHSYAVAWHPVRLGSTEPTAPYVVALALGGTVLLGKAWLLIDLVMLFTPVLAAVGAFVASGRLVSSRPVRAWMAAAYALLPVVTGATSAGRVGTVAATILLPWLVVPVAGLLRAPGRPPWRHLCGTAVGLALVCAFAPLGWLLAAALLAVGFPWLVLRHRAVGAFGGLGALLLSAALLLPWSQRFVTTPQLFLTEAGVNAPFVDSGPASTWQVAFGRLGAAGQAPWWLTAGLVGAALLALLRADSRARVATAWAVGAVALGIAAALSRQLVLWPGATVPTGAWLGFPVTVAQAAAIAAAGLGADGMSRRIAAGSFGWRQPMAAAAVLVGVSAPVAALVWWAVAAPHGELLRQEAVPLPAYLVDAIDAPNGPGVLVVTGTDRQATYDVLAGDGRRLGDDSVLPALPALMATRVETLLAPGGSASAAGLREAGIGYVVLPRPTDVRVAARLDASADLTRASAGLASGWRVEPAERIGIRPQTSDDDQAIRTWQLVGQGALWLLVLLGASPGLARPLNSPTASP